MKLPSEIREEFRDHGRTGGLTRATRMSPERRRAVAHYAAAKRWIRERFGSATFEELGLPGGEVVDKGLADLAARKLSLESLLVSLAAPRLRREGVPVGPVLDNPEDRLFELLSDANPGLAHARYGAWLRQISSFADACRLVRRDRRGLAT